MRPVPFQLRCPPPWAQTDGCVLYAWENRARAQSSTQDPTMDAFGALSEPLRAPSFKTLASSSLPLSILTPNVTPTRLQCPSKCSTLWIKYIYLFVGIIYSCKFDRKIRIYKSLYNSCISHRDIAAYLSYNFLIFSTHFTVEFFTHIFRIRPSSTSCSAWFVNFLHGTFLCFEIFNLKILCEESILIAWNRYSRHKISLTRRETLIRCLQISLNGWNA